MNKQEWNEAVANIQLRYNLSKVAAEKALIMLLAVYCKRVLEDYFAYLCEELRS